MSTTIGPAQPQAKPAAGQPSRRRLRITRDWYIGAVLGILGIITFVPIFMLLQLSLKDEQQMAVAMWLPDLPLHFDNYVRAFYVIRPYLVNSAGFVVASVTIGIVLSILSAYAVARYPFPGREIFFFGILALTMIPNILTLIPSFVLTIQLGLNNTYPGVWLPIASGAQAFQIIVLRAFFASVPQELFDAARIDGAGELRILTGIVLPMAKPILATLIVLDAMSIWNEYIWPLMVLSDPRRYPVMLQVLRMVQDAHDTDPGGMFAAYTLVSLPLFILFAFTSRAFIRGLTSGAVKM